MTETFYVKPLYEGIRPEPVRPPYDVLVNEVLDRLAPPLRELTATVARAGRDLGTTVWLVGGPVRDLLIDRSVRDLDFVCEDGSAELAATVVSRTGGFLRTFDRFLTFKIVGCDFEFDVATARRETYAAPGALPSVVKATIDDDLRRRDFSINALAVCLRDHALVDLVGGVEDLNSRAIRAMHDKSFEDDPTRILRALRLSMRLGFHIESNTRRLLHKAIGDGALTTISDDRFWRELFLALEESDPVATLMTMVDAGALGHLGIDSQSSPMEHLRVARAAAARPGVDRTLLYAGALAATAPRAIERTPMTAKDRGRARRLVESAGITAEALATDAPLPSRLASARACDLETLALAEAIAPGIRATVDAILASRSIDLPFSANDLDLPPGPHLGTALADTREALATGTIVADESLHFARSRALSYLRRER